MNNTNITYFKYFNLLWMFFGTSGSFFNPDNLTLNLYVKSKIKPNGHIQPQNTLPKIIVSKDITTTTGTK